VFICGCFLSRGCAFLFLELLWQDIRSTSQFEIDV
jgi:hypothetical protein